MARLRVLLFASVLCSLAVYGQGGVTTPETVTITVPSAAPSLAPSTAAASSTSSKAADASSTASKVPDVDTTTPASTTLEPTTPPETTTTSTTTTTTPAPNPAPAPTPAPAPGPVPPPEQGMWYYMENNVTCILVQFAAQLNITYNKNVNNSTSLTYMLLNVPKNASVTDGSCNATGGEQFLTLGWADAAGGNNTLVLHFALNDTTKSYALSSLNVTLAPNQFPNSSWTQAVQLSHSVGWWTPLATSYRCAAATQLNMSTELWPEAATLTLSKLQEEAFMRANNTKPAFSAARDCGGSDVPDAVPIAVGCALGGLVLVVLAAYLVARRRSAARGYLSM